MAAVLDDGHPRVVANAEGNRLTPSRVFFPSDGGTARAGTTRTEVAEDFLGTTVSSIKRHMGTASRVPAADRTYSPEEVSALILSKVKADLEAHLGQPVEEAVISVPACFNDRQRQATKKAARLAGLNVLQLINEPTAAALAYGLGREEAHTVLVWDLGGGTFDVSILELGDGVFEVRAVSGDNRLGGDDVDERTATYLGKEYGRITGSALPDTPLTRARLLTAAEQAKIRLSQQAAVRVDLATVVPGTGRGAAIHAGMLLGQVEKAALLDVLPLSLGIETQGELMGGIISRNAPLPASGTRIVTTAQDYQATMDIHLLQGERALAKDNISLGRFQLTGLPVAQKGVPKVEIDVAADVDGTVHVSARDLLNERAVAVNLVGAKSLDAYEIESLVTEAQANAREDLAERTAVQTRIEASNLASTASALLTSNTVALSPAQDERLRDAVAQVEQASGCSDTTRLAQLCRELRALVEPLAAGLRGR